MSALGTAAVATTIGCVGTLLGNRRVWSFSADDAVFAAPTVTDGVVYVAAEDSTVRAFDAADGAVRWTFETDDPTFSAVSVGDDTVFAGDMRGNVYALTTADG